jgi:hypothetical protein
VKSTVVLNTKEVVFCHMFSLLLAVIGRLTVAGNW